MAASAPAAKHSLAEFSSIWFCSLWASYWVMLMDPFDSGWIWPISISLLFSLAGASFYGFRRWHRLLPRLIWVTLLGLVMVAVHIGCAMGLLWWIVDSVGAG